METALLAPLKRFDAAKGRLSPILDGAQRAELVRVLAAGVLRAAPGPAFVACDHEAVAEWADQQGAGVLWTPGLGLNGAVDHGVRTIAGKGFDHVIVAHGDLPLPASLSTIAMVHTVTIVPDRHRDGTNVLAMPLDAAGPIAASYGPGSFARHVAAAVTARRRLDVRFHPGLSLDVDTPADLAHPTVLAALPPWLRTILAGRR